MSEYVCPQPHKHIWEATILHKSESENTAYLVRKVMKHTSLYKRISYLLVLIVTESGNYHKLSLSVSCAIHSRKRKTLFYSQNKYGTSLMFWTMLTLEVTVLSSIKTQ